jgi:hypothetical protein
LLQVSLKYSGSRKNGRKKVLDRKLNKVEGKRRLKRGKGMFRNKENNGERKRVKTEHIKLEI